MMTALSYYGLSFNPFDKQQVKEKDRFLSQDLQEMLNRLDYLKDTRGIGVFTAGPGMGKSFALQHGHGFAGQQGTGFQDREERSVVVVHCEIPFFPRFFGAWQHHVTPLPEYPFIKSNEISVPFLTIRESRWTVESSLLPSKRSTAPPQGGDAAAMW